MLPTHLSNSFSDWQAPEGAPVSSGVVVEQGEACLYVKVNCRDRRGLLGDIILALKSMPLEVRLSCQTDVLQLMRLHGLPTQCEHP